MGEKKHKQKQKYLYTTGLQQPLLPSSTKYQQMQINVSLNTELFLPDYNPPHPSSSSLVLLNLMRSLAAVCAV